MGRAPFQRAGPTQSYPGHGRFGAGFSSGGPRNATPVYDELSEEDDEDDDQYYESYSEEEGANIYSDEYKYYAGQEQRERGRQEAAERERQQVWPFSVPVS